MLEKECCVSQKYLFSQAKGKNIFSGFFYTVTELLCSFQGISDPVSLSMLCFSPAIFFSRILHRRII
jgi:hypothetical protein